LINQSPIRLIIHTQYYPPEIGAPQNRLSELANELANHGVEVIVLTAMPNYPLGKIYPGYGGLFRIEYHNKIRIIRCAIIPSQKASFLPRLVNYFSFVIFSLIIGFLKLPKSDYLLTESPPLFLGITGYLLSKLKNAQWIFNVSDLWPQSAVELGVIESSSFAFRVSSKLEALFYKHAWLVTGQSKAIIENIRSRFPETNLYHLSNGVDTTAFLELIPEEHPITKIVYAGLHGMAQGLDQIVEAAHVLRKEPVEFVLVGDGPEKQNLIRLKDERQIQNISFKDPVFKADIPQILSMADVIFVPLKIQLTGAVPSKLYEAMASAKPVILMAGDEAAEIVNNAHCGIVIQPGDVSGLVEAIKILAFNRKLRLEMGMAGRIYVDEHFNRRMIAGRFYEMLIDQFQGEL